MELGVERYVAGFIIVLHAQALASAAAVNCIARNKAQPAEARHDHIHWHQVQDVYSQAQFTIAF